MNNTPSLPALASYKPQCYHSSENWLAYQSGLEEIRLIEFSKDNTIDLTYQITIGPEPLKCVKMVYSPEEKEIYVGLAQLTKYMILKKNKTICTFTVPLTCNISDFSSGMVAVDGVNDGLQIYFVFASSKGQITTVSAFNPETKVNFNIQVQSNITSLCIKPGFAYVGTERGQVLKVDMNSRKIIEKYQSGQLFPIYNIRIANNFLLLGTCLGELHVLNHDLKDSKIVSAHEGMVALLHFSKDMVYSVGDDLVLRKWSFSKEGTLTETSHQFYDQKPNMVFTVNKSTYLNFYEGTELVEL